MSEENKALARRFLEASGSKGGEERRDRRRER
jgi:hypothetical protein